jgi:hypothetical protein
VLQGFRNNGSNPISFDGMTVESVGPVAVVALWAAANSGGLFQITDRCKDAEHRLLKICYDLLILLRISCQFCQAMKTGFPPVMR